MTIISQLNMNDRRLGPIYSSYRPSFSLKGIKTDCFITIIEKKEINPNDTGLVRIQFVHPEIIENISPNNGDTFFISEGQKVVGIGIILSIE